jgi:hypothetical protein
MTQPPSLTVTPAVAAPGQTVTITVHMTVLPSNFLIPSCSTVDLLSPNLQVFSASPTGLLAVATVTAPGDYSAVVSIPVNAVPGTYTVSARSCGVTWMTTTGQVRVAIPSSGADIAPDVAGTLVIGGCLLLAAARRMGGVRQRMM